MEMNCPVWLVLVSCWVVSLGTFVPGVVFLSLSPSSEARTAGIVCLYFGSVALILTLCLTGITCLIYRVASEFVERNVVEPEPPSIFHFLTPRLRHLHENRRVQASSNAPSSVSTDSFRTDTGDCDTPGTLQTNPEESPV